MPSFANMFGLSYLTAWLSGSSKANKDTTKSKKPAKHGRMQTITISSDLIEGKTFEEAMATLMDAMPPSPTDSVETDGLVDELEATSLSENPSRDADTVSHKHIQHLNEEKPLAMSAALNTLNDAKPGCQCCGRTFRTEYEFTKIKQAAKSLGPGSTEFFDAIAHVYHYSPSQVARGIFLKRLINSLQEQNWIGLDSEKEGGVKVMDYAAGTGILSQALAPHVTEILAVDKSSNMVEQYNKIMVKGNESKCEMRAVQGDLISPLLSGKKVGLETPDGVFAGFDMVAMCLAVDFFTHEGIPEDIKHKQLVRSLDVMINLIDENGTLLIIDIEKCDRDSSKDAAMHSPGSPHEGLKVTGHGSKDIIKALEELGMEDIAVVRDKHFLFETKHGSGPDAPTMRRKELYFVLKAKRGALFEKTLFQRCEGFYRANGFTDAGGEGWA